jgi:hypothetical protein
MASPARPFPRKTLEQALRIPRALKENNGGNPWESGQVAKAIGLGERSGNFFYISAASQAYGLTKGTRETKEISLTELGRQVVYPTSGEQERDGLLQAFLSVETFRGVLQHFGGSKLPEKQFLANTLQTRFNLDPAVQDEFVDLFQKNCKFLGIGANWSDGSGRRERAAPSVTSRGLPPSPPESETVTVAQPDVADAPICFVIMPFRERDEDDRYATGFFAEVFESLFTPAATAAGFTVKTARRAGSDMIQSTIVNELLEADLVLADLTAHNPNVLFELGMRMHEDKPVALVRARGTQAIFDVDNMLRVEDYDPNLWTSTIKEDLPKIQDHIKAAWDDRDSVATYMKLLRRHQAAA